MSLARLGTVWKHKHPLICDAFCSSNRQFSHTDGDRMPSFIIIQMSTHISGPSQPPEESEIVFSIFKIMEKWHLTKEHDPSLAGRDGRPPMMMAAK